MEKNKMMQVIPEEKTAYADLLEHGVMFGLIILVATFFVYVSGTLSPQVPLDELNKYIIMSASEYSKAIGLGTGWSWMSFLNKGDYINFIGIAFLSLVTILAYAVIIPIFFKKGNKVYAAMAILEIIVLVSAASGIFGSAGH